MTIALSGSGAAPVVHSISLTWGASTSSVIGYNVYTSSHAGGPYTKVNSNPSASLNYSDTNVVSGQSYYFVVTAENSSGMESAYSNQAVALIPQS
jgi:fibronectin type 3 domain-containing protein